MKLYIPKGRGTLASALQAIIHGAGIEPESEGPHKDKNGYVSNKSLANAVDMLARLNQGLTEKEQLAHLKKTAVKARQAAHAKLQRAVRDVWAVVKRRTRREDQPATLLPLYGLSDSGRYPANKQTNLWMNYARQVIEAENTAIAEGFEPLTNPSVTALSAVLTQVVTAREAEAGATQALLDQQERLNDMIQEAINLVSRVFAEIRLELRGRDATYIRNVIRSYGGRYEVEPKAQAEAEEPEETETPNETQTGAEDDLPTASEGGETESAGDQSAEVGKVA